MSGPSGAGWPIRPDAPSSRPLRLARAGQLFEPGMPAQTTKNRIDSEVRTADFHGDGEEQFQLFDGRVMLAHHDVDARQILDPIEPSPGLLADGQELPNGACALWRPFILPYVLENITEVMFSPQLCCLEWIHR